MTGVEHLFRLDGKKVAVPGGGQGIGRAVAEMFSAAGATIAVIDIGGDKASEVAGTLPGARAYHCDIADEAAVTNLFAKSNAQGTADVLVHAAAILPKREFTQMTAARWDELHTVNIQRARRVDIAPASQALTSKECNSFMIQRVRLSLPCTQEDKHVLAKILKIKVHGSGSGTTIVGGGRSFDPRDNAQTTRIGRSPGRCSTTNSAMQVAPSRALRIYGLQPAPLTHSY